MINAVNEQFSRFVAFAQERFDAGKTKAIASKGDIMAAGGTTLEERKIKVTDKFDWVSLSFLRSVYTPRGKRLHLPLAARTRRLSWQTMYMGSDRSE